MPRVLYKFFPFILVFSLIWWVVGCEPFGSSKGAGVYGAGYGPTSHDVGPGTGTPYVYGGGQPGSAFPQYLYVPSLGVSYPPPEINGSLNVVKLSQDGSLELVGGPVGGGSNHPQDSFISPDGKYAYVGDPWDYKVDSYTVDPSSQALTHIASHAMTAQSYSSMVLDQVGGKVFSYVAGWDGSNIIIAGIGQDQMTGALVDGSVAYEPLSGYSSSPKLAVLQGKYLYALGNSKIVRRDIKADGSFESNKPEVVTRGEPAQFVFSPDGKFAYALQQGSDYDLYSVDSGTGELSGPEYKSLDVIDNPLKALSHPSKPFLFVLDGESNSIYTFAMNSSDGSLALVSSLDSLPDRPSTLVMDLSGQYLLVGISHTQVPKESGFLVYEIGDDGALSQVSSFLNELFYTLADGCTIAVGR